MNDSFSSTRQLPSYLNSDEVNMMFGFLIYLIEIELKHRDGWIPEYYWFMSSSVRRYMQYNYIMYETFMRLYL